MTHPSDDSPWPDGASAPAPSNDPTNHGMPAPRQAATADDAVPAHAGGLAAQAWKSARSWKEA